MSLKLLQLTKVESSAGVSTVLFFNLLEERSGRGRLIGAEVALLSAWCVPGLGLSWLDGGAVSAG